MIFALDPLFLGDAGTLEVVLIVILKVLVAFGVLLLTVMLYIWWMRKFISDMQNRVGPSRAGPFGILQTLADGIKLFFKEDLIPNKADKFVFKLAPFFSIVPALLVFTVVPVAGDFSSGGDGTVTWFGNKTFVQLADPHIGILFVLAMSSIAVYGIMLAGWSSGSKYPLLGSVRASAQMVSYEAALGLALVAVLMKTGTLSTHNIALSQSGGIADWGLVVTGFVPFFIFFIATTAELNTPPFDLVEAEQELVGGFHTEYSSIRFALFFMAEFMNVITMSGVMVTLFFGGPGVLPPIWPSMVLGFVVVCRKSIHLRFRICVDAGNTTKAKVRPTHGLRMEIAHPLSTWLGNAPRNSRCIQRSRSRQRFISTPHSSYQRRNANLTRRFTHEIHIYWKTQARARRGRGIRMKSFTLTAFSNHLEGNK